MRKCLFGIAAFGALHSAALAQNTHPSATVSPHRLLIGAQRAVERDALYIQAASVAARAGVVSPANGPLSQEELVSILMLMSLRQAPASHPS